MTEKILMPVSREKWIQFLRLDYRQPSLELAVREYFMREHGRLVAVR